jgi:hypothetical protein
MQVESAAPVAQSAMVPGGHFPGRLFPLNATIGRAMPDFCGLHAFRATFVLLYEVLQ